MPAAATKQEWPELLALIVREFGMRSSNLLTPDSKFFGGLDDGDGAIECTPDDVIITIQAVEEQWGVTLKINQSLPLVQYTLGTVFDALIEALTPSPL